MQVVIHETVSGAESCRGAPLRDHGSHSPRQWPYPILGTFLFHLDSQVLLHQTVLSLAKRVRRMGIGHMCGHLNVECVLYTFVRSCVTTEAYICIRAHLFRCSVWLESLFDQHFHSLIPCNFLTARKHTAEA